jgi:uncharacterized protein
MWISRVSKFLLVIVCLAHVAAAPVTQKSYAPFPQPDTGYVTDLADLLTKEQEERIEQWLFQAEEKSGVEVVVVTVTALEKYAGTPGTIEQFATGLFNKWGIGNLPKNDGVMLLISVDDRKARIELGTGYGKSRDADARLIMDDTLVPYFRDGKYADGIEAGVKDLVLEFAHVRIGYNWPLIIVAVSIPIVLLVAISLFRNGKRGWGWVALGLLLVLLLGVTWVVVSTLRAVNSRGDSDSWSPGGFGGGFGGGSSSGGGATGSW